MGKYIVFFLSLLLFLLSPLVAYPIFAQTVPVSSTVLLQATTQDFTAQQPSVWEGSMPVGLHSALTTPVFDMEKISVVNGPGRMLLLPNTAGNTPSLTQTELIQGSPSIPVQTTTANTSLSNQIVSSDYTFPVNHGTIVIDNAPQTLSNKTLSGKDNTMKDIPNSALVNSGIKVVGGAGISISADSVGLGGTITITNTDLGSVALSGITSQASGLTINGGGIITVSSTSGTITISATEADTLASVTGRGAITTTALTLTNSANDITAGTLRATGGTLDGLTIGNTTPASGKFTTVNGLTITNNGSNTLNIAAGKTLVANNSVTLAGTDGTIITFPTTSDTLIGRNSTDTLTNKTLTAGSNTISGLTNANFSGTAGITNANLANPSATLSTGTGLAGGGTITLGSTLTLTNAGVTSLTGTNNQVNISGTTGGVTLSLPQSVAATSTPTFASLALSSTSNQLVLGTTNTGTISWTPSAIRTLTLPDTNDTLIGKTTTDTLTNKTLSSPTINGTITTTGVTLPAFTASGTITGSGSPTITNFGSINGITLASAVDGVSISGGTTPRILTLTGADITIGNTIKPTSAGGLTVQSNGTNSLTLDAGGTAGINIGTINANAITLGADATVSAAKSLTVTTADKLTEGGKIVPQSLFITIPLNATSLTQVVFIADTTYQITGIKCIPSGLSISGTLQLTVDTGTQAAGAGVSQLTGAINLSGTANTVVNGTLIGSPTILNAGDRISSVIGGLLTGLLGNCTIYLKRA